ncbi:hypothetical protein D6777_04325 [Candidatus Woesearchaeota archaeon]|nr:MAG: hypothetical protein D6777_04325 [Candidatus Woesearchaeota archaeon]
MADIRRVLIIFVIAVLFAIFVNTLVDAIYPAPKYEDYCKRDAPPSVKGLSANCSEVDLPDCENGGFPEYSYNRNGCVEDIKCNYCQRDMNKAREKHNMVVFIISTIFGLAAIALALWLPIKPKSINEWIFTGFMLGGLVTLFIGTAKYYADMVRLLRPVVIFLEIVIVIYIAHKKLK